MKKLCSNIHVTNSSEPFEYNNGVKQGCKLAPTLLSYTMALYLTSEDLRKSKIKVFTEDVIERRNT